MARRVMRCQSGCEKPTPATWKHGTWYACDDCIRPLLGNPLGTFLNMFFGKEQKSPEEMFEEGWGSTIYGTAYRSDDYFDPPPNWDQADMEGMTVKVDEGGDSGAPD